MDQPTTFQIQYPLNKSKKFWKKMVAKSLLILLYLLPVCLVIGMSFSIMVMSPNNNGFQPGSFVLIGLAIYLGLFIVLTVIYAMYYKTYINRYYYECGEEFITIKKNVFTPTEIHVQYQKIQDVYVDQDIFDRMFGLYDVHIASATVTSGIEAHIDGVNADVADGIKNIILSKIKNAGNGPTNSRVSPQSQEKEKPAQFRSTKEVSSKTYPISKLWIRTVMAQGILFGLILFVILLLDSGIFLFALFVFAFTFFAVIWGSSIWKKNYYFEFTPDYLLLRTGFITKEEKHMPYKSIQNITNTQGIIDRMFGLSVVKIENAASQAINTKYGGYNARDGISLVWQPKKSAEELGKILNDIVSKINPQGSNSMGL